MCNTYDDVLENICHIGNLFINDNNCLNVSKYAFLKSVKIHIFPF